MRFSQALGPAAIAALALTAACTGAANVDVGVTPGASPTAMESPAPSPVVTAPVDQTPTASPSPAAQSTAAQAVVLIDGAKANVASDFKMAPGTTMSFQFGHQGEAAKQGDVLLGVVVKDLGTGAYGYSINIVDLKNGVGNPKVYVASANVATATTDGKLTKRAGAFDFTFKGTLQDNNKTESHLFEITATLPL